MEHKIADNTDDILNMWKEHFETLSTVDLNQHFEFVNIFETAIPL
jgi:hypothetical protein